MMFGLQDKVLAMIGGGLAAVLGCALAFVWISSHFEIKSLKGERDRLQSLYDASQADLGQCRTNRITLEEATRRQNAAVDVATGQLAARIGKLTDVTTKASAAATVASSSAKRILSSSSNGDLCKDADALILGEVK